MQLVVLVVGPGSTKADVELLVEGLARLAEDRRGQEGEFPQQASFQTHLKPAPPAQPPPPPPPQQQQQQLMTPREAFFAPTIRVPLAEAEGRVCAELLCPYPPGVPLLFPGEAVGAEAVAALRGTLESGGVVVGAGDPSLQTVLVVAGQGQGEGFMSL
jgi:arginine/lysine/ornithine decarboxylase